MRRLGSSTAISGELQLVPPSALEDALVWVALRDTSLLDAPARLLAETRFRASGTLVERIPFRVPLAGPAQGGAGLTLAAEVRLRDGPDVKPGDYLNTDSIPWSADQADPSVVITVHRV